MDVYKGRKPSLHVSRTMLSRLHRSSKYAPGLAIIKFEVNYLAIEVPVN